MAEHNEIGKTGEEICRLFLVKHGYSILDKNYRTNYGEIDIIAYKDNILRFVEVKSIKVRDFRNLHTLKVRPEDNLTKDKWRKLVTSINSYIKHKENEGRWQIDLACVYIDTETRQGLVKLLENIHLE